MDKINFKISDTTIQSTYLNSGIYDGMLSVTKGDYIGFYDTTGKLAVDFRFKDVSVFNNGIAAVEENGKWIIIDKKREYYCFNRF